MPVSQRGSSYQATVNFKGQRYRNSFKTKLEAQTWELQTKTVLTEGGTIIQSNSESNTSSSTPRTLRYLFELTYSRYWKGTKGEKTATVNAIKCISTLGEHLLPAAVTQERLDDMIFMFEAEGISDSTINRRLSALSKMLTVAQDRGLIASKPKIERKREPENRIRFLSVDEEESMVRYVTHIGQADVAELLLVAINTGLRMGEIRRLTARDLGEGLITVWESKSGKPRSVPLISKVKAILEARAVDLNPTDKLFEGMSKDKVRHYWDLGRRHLGLTYDTQFVPHAMRHTFCSRLVQRGVDIVSISKLAGHSSIQMTMRYAHLAPDNLRSAINVLEEA